MRNILNEILRFEKLKKEWKERGGGGGRLRGGLAAKQKHANVEPSVMIKTKVANGSGNLVAMRRYGVKITGHCLKEDQFAISYEGTAGLGPSSVL
ncbi:hypothetical protein GWI33_008539 [Rhynchophorus ferrugineus]|uniref:Uncharacterized protein n=1 Tax=Rhynchophorus ferrugineus TaxID=354439 RepID=A0A834MC55_RHYFE|nr:hypothetical protein GWI33_008539 [Rhynchophorus ferrugineus]